jgi:DNA-binding NtrC family response regulator
MQAVYTMIENVGRVDLTVLITGESGTGKELAAEALHLESHRKNRPLVKVDCTAIPESLLESELFGHRKGSFTGADRDRMGRILQADGGTLFLDEIGDISPLMQLRLLRFLQESTFYPVGQDTPLQVDVRVITAPNVDLKEKVRLLLADHFITRIAPKVGKTINGLSDQARQRLLEHRWPGNVRELEHVIERACVLCPGPTISTDHLPLDLTGPAHPDERPALAASAPSGPLFSQPEPAAPPDSLSPAERILQALRRTGGNKAKAARLLGIDRTTLYRKIKELRLDLSRVDF